jgi:hypothetical protein
MTIRRTALAVVTAGALALTACSGDDGQDADSTTPTPTEDNADGAGFTEMQLGETFTYTGDDEHPADVDITVEDISVSNSCHNGIASYMEGEQEDPESTFVQVSGEMYVKEDTWSDSFLLSVTDWVAVDADGYTLEVAPPHLCETDQINTWSNPLGVGQKRRIVEEFEVKGTPVEWGVKPVRSSEGWGWTLNAPTDSEGQPDGPAPTPAGQVPAPAAPTPDAPAAPAPQPGPDTSGDSPLVEDLDDIAPDRHNGPGPFEPAR